VFSQPESKTANLAWLYSSRADSIFRFYAQWRMQLFPYIYSYAYRSRIEGKHMLGKFPENIYQYTFGDQLLVAPVYKKGATTQNVFLPEGKWINYWTGENMQGNTEHKVSAPIDQIPLFVKQGSIIPMRNYASSVEKGNNNVLTLHIYPGADGSFNLLEDDGTSNDYLKNIYASTMIELKNSSKKFFLKINEIEGNYKGMSISRKWILNIHCTESPNQIRMNRQNLKFSYDKVKKIAIVETSQKSAKQLLSFEVSY
jgi:alpha-glucosidase (family GH31 glycosyl hydrolase)